MTDRAEPGVTPLTDATRSAIKALFAHPCDCEPAWTGRGRHAPDCRYDFIRDYVDEDDIAAVLATLDAATPRP
jgi:hypothetical protein